jgi:hypothetical protein
VRLPAGWARGSLGGSTTIHCGAETEVIAGRLEEVFDGQTETFCAWVRAQLKEDLHPFERTAVEADLELLADFFPNNT